MTAPKKQAMKTVKTKSKLKAPLLDYLIFTKCSSERTVDSEGAPEPFDPNGAVLKLTVSSSCTAVADEDTNSLRAAFSLELEAKATSGEDSTVFYSGEVHAMGYFVCDPTMGAGDIQSEATAKSGYFDSAYNVVHAISSRELERLIELTGIPAPIIPMSQSPDAVKLAAKKA